MSRAARWAIALVLLFVVVSIGLVTLVFLSFSTADSGSALPWRHASVIVVRLEGPIPDFRPEDPLGDLFGGRGFDLRDLTDGLEMARRDDGIKGLFVNINGPQLGWAQNEELRAAIGRFRAAGKWAVAYIETAGEFSQGNGTYLLATACDTIYMAPSGDLGLAGLRVETPFVRGMFDKLGIVPQFGQRKEFKNAADTYFNKDYTDAHRLATGRLMEVLYGEMVTTIAKGRKLTPEAVRDLIDHGPYTGPEAKDKKLVDDLKYVDEVRDLVRKKAGTASPLVSLRNYLRRGRPHDSGSQRIAVVYASGAINRGESGQDLINGATIGSATLSRALRAAREDTGVKAVVLRVDSPGGSYVASDVIRREVELTNKKKPVVVSMGNYAASGGYFIAMHAKKIVADRTTLTGSIGVFSGKMVTKQFWNDKVGINWSPLELGKSGKFYSTQEPYDEAGWERMNAMLDRIYLDFTQKAATGRKLPWEQLEPLAHGRVWSGSDALERKLIDRIGGLDDAIDLAREEAGLEPGERFRIVVLPRPQGTLERFMQGRQEPDDTHLPKQLTRVLRLLSLALLDDGDQCLIDPFMPEVQ